MDLSFFVSQSINNTFEKGQRKKMLSKIEFFERQEDWGIALTFDDLRLQTGPSEVLPGEVSLKTRITRGLSLNVPVASAAMDTVTEARLAIELAKQGGIGVIHKNLRPEAQAKEVRAVKNHLHGRIDSPTAVQMSDTVASVLARGNEFQSFPVVNHNGELVGLLTGSNFDFCENPKILVSEIMTRDLITGPPNMELADAYKLMQEKRKKVLPLVDESHRLVGMFVHRDVRRLVRGSHELYNLDSSGHLIVAAAIGTGDAEFARAELLLGAGVDLIVIDTAHGDSSRVYEMLKRLKASGNVQVLVGNISGGESAKRLADLGADGVKVGQGPGSICTTRIVAGVGTPQMSALYRVWKALQGYDATIVADGGIRYPGDISLAMTFADAVMMGKVFAGTDESPGEVVTRNGKLVKYYRGMGSLSAMEAHQGSRDRYGQTDTRKLVPEGVEGYAEYKGPLAGVLTEYLGGLRAGMGYVGAKTLGEFKDRARFDRMTGAGVTESHPHDITITDPSSFPGGTR